MKLLVMLGLVGVGLASPKSLPKLCPKGDDLRLMGFNIQVFGNSKVNKPGMLDHLVKIIKPMHIVLVQEIRQSEKSAKKNGYCMDKLRDALNDASDCDAAFKGQCWTYIVGGRMGRSSSKEQYGYIYRQDRVEIPKFVDYPDTHDYFQRGPLVISFIDRCSKKLEETGVICLHSEPKGAYTELQDLKPVFQWAEGQAHFSAVSNWILIGDFNMDCSYVSSRKQKTIWFGTDHLWKLLIGDKADTTVAKSACAYDRIAVFGGNLQGRVEEVAIDRFDMDGHGTLVMPNADAKRISDHYPVVLTIDSV